MARLAEYLTHLASLYGSTDSVHFDKVKKGSAILQVAIDEPAVPKVLKRISEAKSNQPNQEIEKIYKTIDNLLRRDNATATISRGTGKILDFPGRKLKEPEIYTITQPTSIDGVVMKIGGRDDTIPVTLRDQEGKIVNCQVRGEAYAKELSKYYLGQPIRVHGNGKWTRTAEGVWEIDSLFIHSHEELDITPVNTVFDELRKVEGNGWGSVEDPITEWKRMRGIE